MKSTSYNFLLCSHEHLLHHDDICLFVCSVHISSVHDDSFIADLRWSYILGCDAQFVILYMVSMERPLSYELNADYVNELLAFSDKISLCDGSSVVTLSW